jgi:hypothetical protein
VQHRIARGAIDGEEYGVLLLVHLAAKGRVAISRRLAGAHGATLRYDAGIAFGF